MNDERLLRNGLERWRLSKLLAIEEQMNELNEDYRASQEGLGIAQRNPGEVRQDIIKYLWGKLNRSATELERLESAHQELMEMELPHLIVTFKHRKEEKSEWAFLRF